MPRAAKLYWFLVVAVGCLCLARSLAGWQVHEENTIRFAIYLIAAVLASRLKIRLPGIFGTLSMNYVVIIAALLSLSLNAAILVAIGSTLGQCLIQVSARPKWFQVIFSAGGIPVPVIATHIVLKSEWFSRIDHKGYLARSSLGSMVYFVLNTGTVAGIIAFSAGKPIYQTWRNSYFWTSPQYLVGGGIAGATHFLSMYWGWPALLMAGPPLYLLYRSYTLYLGRIEEQQKHIIEMSRLHLRTIETLAMAIDAKRRLQPQRISGVCRLSLREIGKELKLPPSEIMALEAAALLHDVGKLAVPEYIISKPGKLTDEEFEKMKVHPLVGAENPRGAGGVPVSRGAYCSVASREVRRDRLSGRIGGRRDPDRRAHPVGGRLSARAGLSTAVSAGASSRRSDAHRRRTVR